MLEDQFGSLGFEESSIAPGEHGSRKEEDIFSPEPALHLNSILHQN